MTTTLTSTQVNTETDTEYVTRMETVQATSTLFVSTHSSIIYIPPTTVTTTSTTTTTVVENRTIVAAADQVRNFILVGGQNGSWFTNSQFPRLFQISLDENSSIELDPAAGQGTVWGGVSNGSDWLISGWGSEGYSGAPNPYLYLYNGTGPVNDTIEDSAEAEWHGGDVFAISSNGTSWLLSGMGSGVLNPLQMGRHGPLQTNHLSVGLFDGKKFTDLSRQLPEQMDGILYSNAYNGSDWLIGGGYLGRGVLFEFDGTRFIDLTSFIERYVHSFHSVQSIAWNGHYWLIGGIDFLAKLDGSTFTDLSSNLTSLLSPHTTSYLFAVNSMAWNGSTWLLGGGEPVALDLQPSIPWIASYNSTSFDDLAAVLPQYSTHVNSSILSIAYSPSKGYWVIGGYSGNSGMLLEYQSSLSDLSNLTGDMTYVNWIATD